MRTSNKRHAKALARVMAGFDEAARICVSNAEQQLLKLGLTVERSLLASIASRSEVVVAIEMTAGSMGGDERPLDIDEAQDPLTEAVLAMVIEAETGLVMRSAADACRANRLILQFFRRPCGRRRLQAAHTEHDTLTPSSKGPSHYE